MRSLTQHRSYVYLILTLDFKIIAVICNLCCHLHFFFHFFTSISTAAQNNAKMLKIENRGSHGNGSEQLKKKYVHFCSSLDRS